MQVLISAVRWFIRVFPVLSADYRRRINPRSKCLACGDNSKKTLRYDSTELLVIAECTLCGARRGYNPIVRPEVWSKPKED